MKWNLWLMVAAVFVFTAVPAHSTNWCREAQRSPEYSTGWSSVVPQRFSSVSSGFFKVGIATEALDAFADPVHHGRQRRNQWCWAACSQMILNFHGIHTIQEQVVLKTFGHLINLPGTDQNIAAALTGWPVQSRRDGKMALSYAEGIPVDFWPILQHFQTWNSPLILALNNPGQPVGHAVLLTAITYNYDPATGLLSPQTVVIRDPWPNHPSRQELPWLEFRVRARMLLRMSFTEMP
jgi:hypothetical protein